MIIPSSAQPLPPTWRSSTHLSRGMLGLVGGPDAVVSWVRPGRVAGSRARWPAKVQATGRVVPGGLALSRLALGVVLPGRQGIGMPSTISFEAGSGCRRSVVPGAIA